MGLHSPLPVRGHAGPGNGLHPGLDLIFGQQVGADPGGIVAATHVAYLVYPSLQRANSAADESPEQIISGEQLILVKLLHHLMNGIELEECVLLGHNPVELLIGRGQIENRQIDEIFIAGVLHVEECPLPLVAGFRSEERRVGKECRL